VLFAKTKELKVEEGFDLVDFARKSQPTYPKELSDDNLPHTGKSIRMPPPGEAKNLLGIDRPQKGAHRRIEEEEADRRPGPDEEDIEITNRRPEGQVTDATRSRPRSTSFYHSSRRTGGSG